MQKVSNFVVDKKQTISTFVTTFVAALLALPIALAIVPQESQNLGATPVEAATLSSAHEADSDACPAPKKKKSGFNTSKVTERVVTTKKFVVSGPAKNTNTGKNNGTIGDNSGANANVGKAVVGASVAVNDLVDVNDNNIPVLSNNNTLNGNKILSGNSLDLGIDDTLNTVLNLF